MKSTKRRGSKRDVNRHGGKGGYVRDVEKGRIRWEKEGEKSN